MKVHEIVKVVVSVAMLVVAPFCRAGEDDSKLAFLWCLPGFDRGTVERRVEEANFSVKLVTDWDARPAVKEFGSNLGFEKHAHYRFMGPARRSGWPLSTCALTVKRPWRRTLQHG